jgi:hypothetical protein
VINIYTIRNIVAGLITIGQQFLIDTATGEPGDPHRDRSNGPQTGIGEDAARTTAAESATPKKRGPKPKTATESAAASAPQETSAADHPEKKADGIPVTRDMIRSALAGYMAIPGVGREGGKKLFASFATNPADGTLLYSTLVEVPDEKLAELHTLVQSTALAAAAPDPFAA